MLTPRFVTGRTPFSYPAVNGSNLQQILTDYCTGNCVRCQKCSATPHRHCYCDHLCQYFGDCCYGFEETCSVARLDFEEATKFLPHLHCVPLAGRSHQYIRIVTSCPENSATADERQRQSCEKADRYIRERTFVTDMQTGMVYRNAYCALCHGVGFGFLEFWKIGNKDCPCIHGTIRDTIEDYFNITKNKKETCEIGKNLGKPAAVRKCDRRDNGKPGYTTMCLQWQRWTSFRFRPGCDVMGNRNASLARECHVYLMPTHVTTAPTNHYKNPFCAACSGNDGRFEYSGPECFQFSVRVLDCQIGDIRPPKGGIEGGDLSGLLDLVGAGYGTCHTVGEIFDPVDNVCRAPSDRCRIGMIETGLKDAKSKDAEPRCKIDIFDSNVYRQPVSDQNDNDVITVAIAFAFFPPLGILVSSKSKNEMDREIFSAFEILLRKKVTDILLSDVSYKSESNCTKILGGYEIFYSKFSMFFRISTDEKAKIEVIHELQIWLQTFPADSITSTIVTGNVTLPIPKCEEGTLVKFQLDTPPPRMRNNNSIYDTLVLAFHQLDRNSSTVFLCDLAESRFANCDILHYPKQQFTVMANTTGIVHKSTGVTLQDQQYIEIDEEIYTCPDYFRKPPENWRVMTVSLLTLSILALAYTLTTYSCFSALRTLPGKLIMHLCATLLLAQTHLVLVNLVALGKAVLCLTAAILGHYLWLASFFWMNAIAINTARTFTRMTVSGPNTSKTYRRLCAYAYATPALIVMVCAILHLCGVKIYDTEEKCFITSQPYAALLFSFVLVFSVLTVTNIVLFVVITISIVRVKRNTTIVQKPGESKCEIVLYVKLTLLLGFTWIFGLLVSRFKDDEVLKYLFVISNGISGVLIALGFACNARVKRSYRKRISLFRSSMAGPNEKRETNQSVTTITRL